MAPREEEMEEELFTNTAAQITTIMIADTQQISSAE
jgi:hypothetical protein